MSRVVAQKFEQTFAGDELEGAVLKYFGREAIARARERARKANDAAAVHDARGKGPATAIEMKSNLALGNKVNALRGFPLMKQEGSSWLRDGRRHRLQLGPEVIGDCEIRHKRCRSHPA